MTLCVAPLGFGKTSDLGVVIGPSPRMRKGADLEQ